MIDRFINKAQNTALTVFSDRESGIFMYIFRKRSVTFRL